jgi:HYR domain/Ig-like domain CHU_C associated/Secretion system C-terminal sorting domain/PKD-like domain
MTTVHIADYVFDGNLAPGDAVQTGRLNRFAVVSTCAAPKACPGIFTSTGNRLYDAYTVTNPYNTPVCATIGITSFCATNIFSAAYLGAYDPNNQCVNYLADPGSSFTTTGYYEATIPANATMTIIVHEVNTGTGCAGYRLSVHLPRAGITVSPAAPYCSGTPITLTAPPANNYTWTPGGATTQAIVVNPPLGTTNYSVQSGFGNWGCVGDTSVNIVVGSLPDVNAVTNQFYCAGSSAGPIVLTGSVPGTTYNWTNTNTAIGLAASGTGDIPTFTATNATGAPISGTITVTPVNGPCTGTPITFTITVANTPTITGVTNDEICAPGGVVNLAAAGNGLINWYTAATGGNLVNTGTTFNPNITATTTYYVESQINEPAAQTVAMPGQSGTFPGSVRGYWFTAPVDFVMTGLFVPTTASSGNQQVAVLKFNGNTPPPVFSATTNAFTTLFLTKANTSPGYIAVNIPIKAGEVIGVLGNRADLNSYAPGDYNTTIFGQAVQMQRMGMQFPLSSTDPRDIWREFGPGTSISRIEFTYTSISCSSSPRVPVTGTVNPLPVATATPASQTVCSGPITSIILTSSEPGTTYAWTRDNTVNVTGIPASGTGDISGTLTNNTFVPQTVTFTITPTVTATGCVGAPITATVTVNAVPTITCPANITVNNTPGVCGTIVTYTPAFTGIPIPTITYAFTGATTASGSGDGSGSFFNVGTTTVTITATNSCGFDDCTFTVTVIDAEPPVVTTGTIGSCYASVAAAEAAALAATTATDNCPGTLTEVASTVGTCSAVITVTTTDIAGNFTSVTYNTRIDNTAPVITCPAPVTVSCASAVPAADILLVTVSDNCPGAITVIHVGDVISAQTCANRFTVTRTYRATDGCGNFAECTQVITVNDQTPPTLTCPAPITVSCANAVPAPDVSLVTGVSDNCAGTVTVTHVSDVISAQTCLNRYTITRTYRATDVCGNFAECTQIITVNDQTPPVITCPANITVNNTPNQCGAIVNFTVTATDNCAGTVTITSVPASGSFFPVGTTTVTSTAVDACGNTSTCTFTVTVLDVQPPVITCPANITTGNNPGICGAVVNFPLPTVSDNCPLPGGVTLNQNTNTTTIAFNTGISCNAGATSFWRAYNLASFPAVTGPLTINSVRFGIEVNNTGVAQTMTANLYNQTGAAFPGGTRTLIATGTVSITAAANTFYTVNFASAPTVPANSIIIVEVAAPVGGIFPAANGLGESGPSYISSTACGVPNPVTLASLGFTANHTIIGMSGVVPVVPPILVQTGGLPSGSTFPVGTTTNTFVARDNAGNTSTCSFTVTVNDVEQPTITCPANQTRNTDPGVCYATFPDPPGIPRPTFADNCAVTRLTWSMTGPGGTTTSPASGINYVPNNTQFLLNGTTGTGVTTITYTAADAAGNTRTCSFTVTVNDASIPVISVQPATVFVCEGGNAVFSVTATAGAGNPLAYQWQQWNGSAWVNIGGATSSTLTIPAVAFTQNTNTYRVVLTGRCSVVNSAAATLFVNPLPSVTLLTSIPPAIQPGQSLNITSNVNPPGGTYAWFLNGQLLPTALGSSLNNLTVDNLGTYRLVYTDLNGCVGTSANLVISAFQSEKLWIYPNPNTGRFQIRFFNHVNEQITINVYDMKGSRVYQRAVTPTANYNRIDVDLGTAIPAGFYIVEVRGGNGSLIGKKKIVVYHN